MEVERDIHKGAGKWHIQISLQIPPENHLKKEKKKDSNDKVITVNYIETPTSDKIFQHTFAKYF